MAKSHHQVCLHLGQIAHITTGLVKWISTIQ
jgi:hypothetical protein